MYTYAMWKQGHLWHTKLQGHAALEDKVVLSLPDY